MVIRSEVEQIGSTDLLQFRNNTAVPPEKLDENFSTIRAAVNTAIQFIVDKLVARDEAATFTADMTFDEILANTISSVLANGDIVLNTGTGSTYKNTVSPANKILTQGETQTLLNTASGTVPMTGATAGAAGVAGLVPAPAAGEDDEFLRGDGTFVAMEPGTISNLAANTVITRAAGTTGVAGTTALAASQLLGRGASGDIAAIALGTGLSMSGATLNPRETVFKSMSSTTVATTTTYGPISAMSSALTSGREYKYTFIGSFTINNSTGIKLRVQAGSPAGTAAITLLPINGTLGAPSMVGGLMSTTAPELNTVPGTTGNYVVIAQGQFQAAQVGFDIEVALSSGSGSLSVQSGARLAIQQVS
jgi:hypothetical protein